MALALRKGFKACPYFGLVPTPHAGGEPHHLERKAILYGGSRQPIRSYRYAAGPGLPAI
ncbi:hypothetical protein [Mesorhizobium sp.]|uniref:hypothetical protein n=1 Tax=Mesorhizobium sp. TaxID=1871066 RepID=UPI0025D82507|nr:hypothetical protein [Mesorhizobium sp.]